jgi:Kef-type K+ transport system membrane component KefB
MDATHRTARRDRSIAGWVRFWYDLAGGAIFPSNSSDRQTLNAVSELGMLLLLLLIGMETDLALVRRVRRTAVITSAAGIVIPFRLRLRARGNAPRQRSARSESALAHLALSRNSALRFLRQNRRCCLGEVDYLRRNLGQVILGADLG